MMPSRISVTTDLAPQDAPAPAAGYAIERVAPRTSGTLVEGIQRVRLLPMGAEGSVVNISVKGALILCCKKLGAGMSVRIVFEGSSPPAPVGGKVVRSLVSNIGETGELWYHVGIAFDEPIDFRSPLTTDGREAEDSSDHSSVPPKFVNRW